MKRKIFFLLERLEITRSERISVSVLLFMLVALSSALPFIDSEANYNEEDYAEIQRIFEEKSKQLKSERELILARYEPSSEMSETLSVQADRISGAIASNSDTTDKLKEAPTGVNELININTATNERLQELPGIGPAYAKRIIDWRRKNGSFTNKNQLMEIKGIGEKRLAKMKPLITL